MTHGLRVVVVALILMVSACGNSGGSGSTTPTPATYFPRFGFEVNRGDDTLSVYVINAASGQWLHHGYVPTGAAPVAVAVSPNEKFIYVVNQTDGNISAFQLDTGTGRLASVGTVSAGTSPSALAVTPSGSWLYVVNTGTSTLSGYSIDSSSGALTSIDTDAVTSGMQPTIGSGGTTPVALVMHPTLSLLYVINSGSNTITAFSYNPSTGALTAVDVDSAAGTQLTFTVGTNPSELALERSGKFLYVANQNSNDVSAFRVDSTTGALTAAGTTPTGAGSGLRSVTVHPGGAYVYTANGTTTGTVSIFSVNTTSGALTLVTGTPLSTVVNPRSLRADPSGKFLFVTSETEQVVQGYGVNTASGALTALGVTRTRNQPAALAMSTGTGSLSPQAKHAYVVNSTGGQVRVYSVNTTSGALSFRSTASTGSLPRSIAVDPFSRFAYVVNNPDDSLSGYSINDTTGSLIRIDLNPASTSNDLTVGAGADPQHVVVDPSGRFLYVSLTTAAATGQVRGYTIAVDGKLTEVTDLSYPYTVGADPKQLMVDPTGRYLYVVNQNSAAANGSVSAFSIDSTSGQLVGLGAVAAGDNPEPVAIEPSGRFAYVGNRGAGNSGTTLTRFNIALTGMFGSPGTTTLYPGTAGPVDLAMDPLGRSAYVAAVSPPRLAGYEIASSDGSLSSIGTPTSTTPTPACMEVDPTGRFAYLGYTNETYVSVYSIGSTGMLSTASTADAVGPVVSLALSRRLVSSSSSSGFWR